MKQYLVLKRYFVLVCAAMAVASLLWGCESFALDVNDGNQNPDVPPGKPTVPIKRRPIVPTTKLPRPRIAIDVEWKTGDMIAIKLAEPVLSAEVIVTDVETGESVCIMFDGDSAEIAAIAQSFTLAVNVDGEEHLFVVGDSDNHKL